MIIRAQQHDTLDSIAWRYYRQSCGAVESILQANPGLAELGASLPHGQIVVLPDITPAPVKQPLLQLWD